MWKRTQNMQKGLCPMKLWNHLKKKKKEKFLLSIWKTSDFFWRLWSQIYTLDQCASSWLYRTTSSSIPKIIRNSQLLPQPMSLQVPKWLICCEQTGSSFNVLHGTPILLTPSAFIVTYIIGSLQTLAWLISHFVPCMQFHLMCSSLWGQSTVRSSAVMLFCPLLAILHLPSHTTEKQYKQTLVVFHQLGEWPASPSDKQAPYLQQGRDENTILTLQQYSHRDEIRRNVELQPRICLKV